MSDFDSMVDDSHAAAAAPVAGQMPAAPTQGFDDLTDDSEKYETPGQIGKTFAEGVAQGVAGPLATLAEKKLFHVKPEDILGRQESNPITHGIGQAAGLTGGALTGTGEAALMGKAGELAAGAVGLGKAAEGASLGFKVGSSAVQQAAEMAVLQSGDEVSKMILNDPKTSAESALANIGMAAALGGAGGAFMTGAVSPLWEATAGPKVEALLGGLRSHLNGGVAMLPEELKAAQSALGVEISPEIQAAMSGNPTAVGHYNILKEGQHKAITEGLEKFHSDLSNSVAESLGIAPEDIAVHSENEAGHELLNTFKKEYQQKYEPIAEALEKRNAEASGIAVPDEARLDRYGKILEDGMNKVGTDSPAYKIYNDYGNRLLAKDTIGAMDQLKTEIGGEIDKAMRAGDTNSLQALRDVRSSIANFQEQQIERQVGEAGGKGLKSAQEILNERKAANQGYAQFSKMSNDLTDHLGVGRFSGAKGLTTKLTDKISPEQLLNKFSVKGNADFVPFLQQHFPEVYEQVRQNELKRFLKPAVLSAKGEAPINIQKLNSIVEKGMAGQKDYVQHIMPPEAISRITAANKLTEALPNVKSSGTAGWMSKMFGDMPRSAMAGVAMLTGHNPLIGGILGEMSQRLGRDAPDAIRLAHLKFLASDAPIKAEGFKAMVDFMHNTYKGENLLAKATTNVLKRGAQVLTDSAMPNEADRTKLDKAVTKLQANPQQFLQQQNSHLGHYLPQHQQAVTQSTAQALQYLQGIKPQPHILGPLDKPVPPQPSEIARYNRALDIANQPAVVLQHIKDGTLQSSDIADLHNIFPALYPKMSQMLSNAMTRHHSEEEAIPYRTRIGMALFMGTPIDKSMEPASIMAAQPQPQAPQQPQQGGKAKKPSDKSMNSLGKGAKSYQTPNQQAESDRSNRD